MSNQEFRDVTLCSLLTSSITTVVPLGALWRLMPSVGTLVYQWKLCFD